MLNIITKLQTLLAGKKAYILATLAVIYAISGYITGNLDSQASLDIVWMALFGSSLRAGVAKIKK